MTDHDHLPDTGQHTSNPAHVQLHDCGWLRLPSGVEVAILWDSEHQLLARLGWSAADEWCSVHGFRLPSVAELRELHTVGPHVEPYALPTVAMCRAAGVPHNAQKQAWKDYHNRCMRSLGWCARHDSEVLRRCDEAGALAVSCNSKHHYDSPRGIYGAMSRNGVPIQEPYDKHGATWTSYMLTTVVARVAQGDSEPVSGGGDTEPVPSSGDAPTPDQWRPVLRRGMTGRDVRAWQAVLSDDAYAMATDGDFGPITEINTVDWQECRELQADGVVGPITRAAIGSPPVPVPDPYEPEPLVVVPEASILLPDPMLMLKAKNYTRGHVARDWFILHSTEGGVSDWAPLGIARWCAGQDWAGRPVAAPRASWHYVTGSHPDPYHGVIQCLSEEHTAWTAGRRRANERAIQVEMNGQAMSSDWFGPSMEPTVRRTAALYARAAARWDMPIREVSTDELREARRMIEADPTCVLPERCRGGISHADVTEVWEVPGGHQEPGGPGDRRWPWDLVLDMVRASG